MPKSRKAEPATRFIPAKIEPRVPANEAWIPGLPDVAVEGSPEALVNDGQLNSLVDGPEGPDGQDGSDTGPGSAALAERFELLPIEWITGEPAVETLVFELSDGLSYMGQSVSADESPVDTTDPDPTESLAPPAEVIEESLAHATLSEGDDPILVERGEIDAQGTQPVDDASSGQTLVTDPAALTDPPVGFITEAEHLSQIEAIRAEAFALGMKAGAEEGLRLGLEQGVSRGREEASAELRADVAGRVHALEQVLNSLRQSASDPQRLFVPLKRLSIHLAQQLVRGELTISSEAINRLVEQCLIELDRNAGSDIVLSLNPEELERWRRDAPGVIENVQLRADPSLSMGSVRLSVGESVVEDLIEHRLQSLASKLLGESNGRSFSRMMPLRSSPGAIEDISDVD